MLSGSRPSMASASAPTALTRLSFVESATTEGSESTMPLPFTYTSTLAVPRSIPIFRAISAPIANHKVQIIAGGRPICNLQPTTRDLLLADHTEGGGFGGLEEAQPLQTTPQIPV